MSRDLAETLASQIRGKVRTKASLAPLTTFRVGGEAAVLVEAASEDDLKVVAKRFAGDEFPVLVLGRGSNLLVSDAGVPGVVITLAREFEWVAEVPQGVEAGGATPFPRIANWASRRALAGLEFAIAIPASVGGAVRMNAGAHSSSVSDVLAEARIFRLSEGRAVTCSPKDLEMGYRHTNLAATDVVCSAKLNLVPGETADIAERMRRYRQHRSETQPAEAPNAGSMFRNPEDDTAGRLIQAAGLRGYAVGKARVSDKHANFFLADEGARAQDIYDLMVHVQDVVEEKSGVLLVPEVGLVGEFRNAGRLRWSP